MTEASPEIQSDRRLIAKASLAVAAKLTRAPYQIRRRFMREARGLEELRTALVGPDARPLTEEERARVEDVLRVC